MTESGSAAKRRCIFWSKKKQICFKKKFFCFEFELLLLKSIQNNQALKLSF